ncbi:prepilin-type N-terminal cleavage/methylation domain-containing protein [Candidatus Nomurabacteria bacterium]|nr:prepilin-type N-terminal cleavage/methylation domain-containing protein [Candidatus Nomurabacteria bacterium]
MKIKNLKSCLSVDRLKIKNYKNSKQRGFTILETLVAIFILVLSITGPMVFAQSGLRASFQSRDQITAFYLAQDVIETVKNIRDDNAIDGDDWLVGLVGAGKCSSSNPCMIDTTESSPTAVSCGSTCPALNIVDDVNGIKYTYSGGSESRFTRTTYINQISNDEAEVVVEVEWITPVRVGRNRIVVQENIYNWVPGSGI